MGKRRRGAEPVDEDETRRRMYRPNRFTKWLAAQLHYMEDTLFLFETYHKDYNDLKRNLRKNQSSYVPMHLAEGRYHTTYHTIVEGMRCQRCGRDYEGLTEGANPRRFPYALNCAHHICKSCFLKQCRIGHVIDDDGAVERPQYFHARCPECDNPIDFAHPMVIQWEGRNERSGKKMGIGTRMMETNDETVDETIDDKQPL